MFEAPSPTTRRAEPASSKSPGMIKNESNLNPRKKKTTKYIFQAFVRGLERFGELRRADRGQEPQALAGAIPREHGGDGRGAALLPGFFLKKITKYFKQSLSYVEAELQLKEEIIRKS